MENSADAEVGGRTGGRHSSAPTPDDDRGRAGAGRRVHPRYPVVIDLCCQTGTRSIIAQSRDLSEGGVFMHTSSPLDPGTEVTLRLRLPGTDAIDVDGVVAHRLGHLGMGIRFVRFRADGDAALREFVRGLAEEAVDVGPGRAKRPVDRRARDRVQLATAVRFHGANNFWTGLTGDISSGGIFVGTTEPLPVGAAVDLRFSLPDEGPPIHVMAEVRWTRGAGTADGKPGMGVRFVDLPAEQAHRIEAFVRSRTPVFFDDE